MNYLNPKKLSVKNKTVQDLIDALQKELDNHNLSASEVILNFETEISDSVIKNGFAGFELETVDEIFPDGTCKVLLIILQECA